MFSDKRLQIIVLLMVILSVFTYSFSVKAHAAPDIWSIETVDSGLVGWETSLALDANGYPHISYYNFSSGDEDLKYARWTGSEWSTETVDSSGDVGRFTSLALDANGYPHISYTHADYGNLKYAQWDGSEWLIETVDSAGDVGWSTSLALDSNDYPHISYVELNDNYPYDILKYARWIGDQWDIETLDSGGNVGWYSSLALDSNDYPHISYRDSSNGFLKYAQWSGTGWIIHTIDSSAVDHPHVELLT